MSLLDPIARWVASLRYEKIPPDSLRAARYQLLNMVAAFHAAARSPETSSLAGALQSFSGGKGRSTVFNLGKSYPPAEAALINSAYSMAQDFDDIIWMGHTGHSAVFATLAVAEHLGKGPRELLTAIVAANEVAGRIGASCSFGPLNGQMWTFIHLISAATATAKLLELSPIKTRDALAISLAQPNFALQPGFMTPTSKFLAAATPTATGIQAAFFAQAGMTGEERILEDRRGFWKRFSYLPLPAFLEGLGSFWALQTLTIKTFPGCQYFQTACTAIERLLKEHGPIVESDVSHIFIETTTLGAEVTQFGREYVREGEMTPVGVNFDLKTTAAVMMHAGRLGSAEISSPWLKKNAAVLKKWCTKIEVRHDPTLTAKTISSVWEVPGSRKSLASVTWRELLRLRQRYREEYGSSLFTPVEFLRGAGSLIGEFRRYRNKKQLPNSSAVPLYFPNRVSIRWKDGRKATAQVDLPVATFCLPGVEAELKKKFLNATRPSLGSQGAERAFQQGIEIEKFSLQKWILNTTTRKRRARP